MPNGRALTAQSHDYKRHGTTTLFAAFNVATGAVIGRQYKRRRRIEFLDFMNRVVTAHPGRSSATPTVEAWVRCTAPNASSTNRSAC